MEKENFTGYPSVDRPWMKYYNVEGAEITPPAVTIYDYMRQKTKGREKLTAISYYGKEISYKDFFLHIDEAASVLYSIGVRSEDRIMYLLPNIPETAYLMYGGAKIGAVSDFVDPRPDSIDPVVSAHKILSMLQEEKAKHLIVLDQCYLAMLKPIEQELKDAGIEQIVIVSASDSMDGKAKLNYLKEVLQFNGFTSLKSALLKTKKISELMKNAQRDSAIKLLLYKELVRKYGKAAFQTAEYKADSLAVIVHTSGTSSAKPKPIPLTHDNLNHYTHQTFYANMPLKDGDKALHLLPYFAAYGIVNAAHGLFCHAHNLIQVPEFLPYNLGKIIIKYKPQVIIGAPSWFPGLKESPALQKCDLSFLTMAVYGGDTLEAKDEIAINEFLRQRNCGCILTKGHGMSEVCGCSSYATGEYNGIGSMGIPLPFTKYAIVDSETKEMLRFSADQEYLEGELIISSGAVTSGILDEKEIVPSKLYDGERYIFTRDIARMDRNGIMTFLSRNDRSFTRFDGYKIKPYEIEAEIKKYQEIQYCVVSPLYDAKRYGNVAVADIVLREHEKMTRAAQVNLVERLIKEIFINNPNVSTRQIPMWFRFRDNMPMTVNSKTDHRALAEEILHGDEVCVTMEESNLTVGELKVF